MDFRDNRLIRVISLIVLTFFLWTFGGGFDIAYAINSATEQKSNRAEVKNQPQIKKAEEKFEEALEKIRTAEERAYRKSETGENTETEEKELKNQKAEIEKHDIEIKKQFKDTEEKIKGLPELIKQRHRDFVKKYEENLNTLKANLDEVEKAKTKQEKQLAHKKTKEFLEKTRPPKKHVPLDPNKLPHRTAEPVFKEPRTKPEEFTEGKELRAKGISQKPILVASNGTLDGLLTSNPEDLNSPLFDPLPLGERAGVRGADSPMLLALASPPTEADLAEAIEVQFTPEIKAKAEELGKNPVKIFNWVRNNIEYVPTYGSIQGANMCLQTKQCNDFDTASLLIALLRASNIPAKYVYGTIEVPIDKVKNWVGGFTDSNAALNLIASGGVPVTGLISGGKLSAARMEHVWVKAYVDYIPSFGAVHKQGDTWIPLDVSFKQYTYTQGIDFQTVVPFDGQGFADQIKATATINEQEGYATNINSTLIQTTLSDYNAQLENYVNQNYPNATVSDILGKKEIIKKDQSILPASLPYKTVTTDTETSEISDLLRYKITIQLVNSDILGDTAFTYTASLPQLAGKKITVGYDPATTTDQDTINKYVQQYATSIPAYLINLKPVLKIENTTVASGPSIGMGNAQALNIALTSPKGSEVITHNLLAGDYTAIGLNPSKINLDVLQKRIDKNDFTEAVGEMLHQTVLSYWAEADAFNTILAKTFKVNILRHPSEMTATAKVSITYLYGAPSSATYKSRNIDVKFDNQTVMSQSGDKTKEFSYMQQSGATSSFLEGAVYDQLFGKNIGDSASAITILNAANGQGIPIYRIDSTNITTVLPKLQISNDVKNEISNSINAGLTVQIPQTNITHLGWTGVGYIIMNPADGSGAYRISGGLNGMDGAAEGETAVPLSAVPLTGSVAFVIGALTSNNGVVLRAAGGGLTGIEIAGAASAAVLAAQITLLILLAILIALLVKDLAERIPARYEVFRHYTSFFGKTLILAEKCINASDWLGDLFLPGVYITDLIEIEPSTAQNRQIIFETLKLDSYDKTETYVQMEIDRNRVILISFQRLAPRQYLYPFFVLCHNYPKIIFEFSR